MDKRYHILKERLSLLEHSELERIKSNIDSVCLDTYNYDSASNTFCPLAVAMNLHKTVENPTNDLIIEILSSRFTPVNAIGGVEGEFYTGNHRKEDLLQVIDEILCGVNGR